MLILPVLLVLSALPAADEVDARAAAPLAQQLSALLDSPALSRADVGLVVKRLDDGEVIYEHDADELLIPASNMKVLTTAASLHYLTPDYRFLTEVFAEINDEGRVVGDLYVKGRGDPWLVPERVWYLANRIRLLGVRGIEGNIVVDDTFFAGSNMAAGAEQDHTSYSYMAPAGALSVGFNAVLVQVSPGRAPGEPAQVIVDPQTAYADVVGTVRTVENGRSRVNVTVEPFRDRSRVRVSGRIALGDERRAYWRRIDNPSVYAGEVIHSVLGQVGIEVGGRVVTGVVPPETPLLTRLASPRLADLVERVNKHSNNFMASQIARVLGAEMYGAPGTWDKGQRAIDRFMREEVGLDPDSYVIGNASGLHDVNRLSPRVMVRVLEHMFHHPRVQPEFVASLAVAGGTGTLSERMQESDAARLLRAKTGTLSVASALSGYVTCRSGETLAFSIIVNDYRVGIHDVWQVQDEIGAALAGLDLKAADTTATLGSSPRLLDSQAP